VQPAQSLMKRIGIMFTDGRTWTTLFYMFLMLPLGIIYFTITVTLMAVSIAFVGAPVAYLLGELNDFNDHVTINLGLGEHVPGWGDAVVLCIVGVLLLFVTLHLVRALGRMHGQIAKHLLVSRVAA